jgi:hypothetical protein
MFLPATIDLGQSEKYILSIRISTDKFMFSISDPQDRNNYCLRETDLPVGISLLDNIKRIIFDFNFLTQQYLQTHVVIVSSDYDLVPDKYYDYNCREEMFGFTHFKNEGQVLSVENQHHSSVVLYTIDKNLYQFLQRNLYNPQFHHHSSLLTDYLNTHMQRDQPRMFVYSHDGLSDVLCYSGTELSHSLTYHNANPSDQAYYILKLWENTGLNQISDMLYIAGDIDESVIFVLQKYIKNIEKVGAFSDIYLWHEDAQKAPLDLLALSL